jgi:hypothetical protein
MDVKEYWKAIRKKAAEFDPEAAEQDRREDSPEDRTHLKNSSVAVRLVSVDNLEKGSRGGMVILARPYLAAELLFAGTHRLATDEEWNAYSVEQDKRRSQIEEEARASATKGTRVNVPAEALAAAIAALTSQKETA